MLVWHHFASPTLPLAVDCCAVHSLQVVGYNEAVEGSSRNVFRPYHEKDVRDKVLEQSKEAKETTPAPVSRSATACTLLARAY